MTLLCFLFVALIVCWQWSEHQFIWLPHQKRFRWKSPSKIVARLGQATRGPGDVRIVTKSGGRGTSHVKFRVFITQIGPLEESAVWVDETRTVPGREAIRSVPQIQDERDALGLVPSQKRLDQALLSRDFPDSSGNLRMENFSPQWYLLEHHADATFVF